MKDLTLLICSYNTAELTQNLLKSFAHQNPRDKPEILVINTSSEPEQTAILTQMGIPHHNLPSSTHGEGVSFGLSLVKTKHVLLLDNDVLFLCGISLLYDLFCAKNGILMGRKVGDVAGKKLHPRITPWFTFIDNDFLKQHKISFFDKERTIASKTTNRVYDIGSTMYEDVFKICPSKIIDINVEHSYFIHYGGMSWTVQKFVDNGVDSDIDFGGTHPHHSIRDAGIVVKARYERDIAGFDFGAVDISPLFN